MKNDSLEEIRRRTPFIAAVVAILAVGAAAFVFLNSRGTQSEPAAQPQIASKKPTANSSITVYYDRTDERTTTDLENFHAEEDCTYSWEIDDAEKINSAKSWLTEFEKTHTPSYEPIGYETSVDRYKFVIDGKEVKLNFYDSTAVIIDDNYYIGTTAGDLTELLPLICEDTSIIKVSAGGDRCVKNWTIEDAETVKTIVDTIAQIEMTTPPETGYPTGGGSAPYLSYVYNGRFYYVHVRPNSNELFITIDDSDERLSYFPQDMEIVKEIFNKVLEYEP